MILLLQTSLIGSLICLFVLTCRCTYNLKKLKSLMVNVCHTVIRAARRNASGAVITASEQVLCVCVPAGTPGGLRRCGWTSINSTTTLRGRRPRARPLAGLCITPSPSSLVTQYRQQLQARLCVRQVRGSLLSDLLYTSDVLYTFLTFSLRQSMRLKRCSNK